MSVWAGLHGVKVIEFGQYLAGPYAANVLAYFGADVVKVEPVGGDMVRHIGPAAQEGLTATFASLNLNKRVVALDLSRPESAEVVDALIADADVLIQNLKPGKADEYGIGAERLHSMNPRLVHCSISAFYPSVGATRPGFDILVQADSGIMSITGEPDGVPCRVPVALSDYTIGLWLALGVMNALGGPRDRVELRLCLQDVLMALVHDDVVGYLGGGPVPQRRGSGTQLMNPHRAFPTADGEVVVAAGPDNMFRRLAALLGPPVDDPRFHERADRMAARAELDELISEFTRAHTTAHWMSELERIGIPCAEVRPFSDAIERHRDLSPTGVRAIGDVFVAAPPIEVVGEPWDYRSLPGALGADTIEVLRDAGLPPERIDALIASGVLHSADGAPER